MRFGNGCVNTITTLPALNWPSELTGLLRVDMIENLDPGNLRRYSSDDLRDLCRSLVWDIQSQLEKGRSGGGQGGQGGQSGQGGQGGQGDIDLPDA